MLITSHDIKVLDTIRKAVDRIALPLFWESSRTHPGEKSDKDLFQRVAELRSYSGTRADRVTDMIKTGHLASALAEYDVSKAAQLKAAAVLDKHWDKIKAMRFPSKVGEMIQAASAIISISREFGSFHEYLESWQFPKRVACAEDITRFWQTFDLLRADLKNRDVPIFSTEVTLLHFLEHEMQLDCLKPDLVVRRVLTNTGIVPSRGKTRHRVAVLKIQEYCIQRDTNPKGLDRYLLAFGGQTDAKRLVSASALFCSKKGSCGNPGCPVGHAKLCPTWKGGP